MVHSVDVINEHSDGSGDQWINEEVTEESAAVSMAKEDAANEPGAIHTHACRDENESANAADSWGIRMTRSRRRGRDAAHSQEVISLLSVYQSF